MLFCNCQINNGGAWRIGLHGCNAVFHGRARGIHLALANDLSIAGIQDEVWLVLLGGLAFVIGVVACVLLDRLDAILGAGLLAIEFAGQNDLAAR